jgi:hypothetical protein
LIHRRDSIPTGSGVPLWRTLEGFAHAVAASEGVSLSEIAPVTQLLVRTDNSLYRIVALDPTESAILIQGGRFFPEMAEGRLCGSSFGGGLLKTNWIGVGLRMEIYGAEGRIVTSPVRSITVEDEGSLPGPF